MISITFPIAQENIRAESDRVSAAIKALDAERQILVTMWRQIQSFCKHEGQRSYRDISGESDLTPCIKCGSTS